MVCLHEDCNPSAAPASVLYVITFKGGPDLRVKGLCTLAGPVADLSRRYPLVHHSVGGIPARQNNNVCAATGVGHQSNASSSINKHICGSDCRTMQPAW